MKYTWHYLVQAQIFISMIIITFSILFCNLFSFYGLYFRPCHATALGLILCFKLLYPFQRLHFAYLLLSRCVFRLFPVFAIIDNVPWAEVSVDMARSEAGRVFSLINPSCALLKPVQPVASESPGLFSPLPFCWVAQGQVRPWMLFSSQVVPPTWTPWPCGHHKPRITSLVIWAI